MAKGKKPQVPPGGNSNQTNVQKTAFKQKKSKKAFKNRGFLPSTVPQPPPPPRAPTPASTIQLTARPLAISKIPYFQLPDPVEKSAMKISYIQYKLKHLLLLRLHSILCTKGLLASPSAVDIDMQDILQIVKKGSIVDPVAFFNHPLAPCEVDNLIAIRNNTDHFDLTSTNQNWQTELPSYVVLCHSINEPGIAAEIQSIIDRMMAGILDGLVEFSFQFTPGFTYEKAFGLSQIVYGVLLAFLAKEIWTFLKVKLGINNITLDLYANLKYIKNQLKVNPDFLAPGGASRADRNLVQIVYDTRMDNAHGRYIRATARYRPQLQSTVEILDVINKHDVSLQVQAVSDRLVTLEANGATVTQAEFTFLE
jgi:hypothetical protein